MVLCHFDRSNESAFQFYISLEDEKLKNASKVERFASTFCMLQIEIEVTKLKWTWTWCLNPNLTLHITLLLSLVFYMKISNAKNRKFHSNVHRQTSKYPWCITASCICKLHTNQLNRAFSFGSKTTTLLSKC